MPGRVRQRRAGLVAAVALGLLACRLSAQAPAWQPSSGHTQRPIWPATAAAGHVGPDSESYATGPDVAGRPWHYIQHVSRPTLTVYPPDSGNTGVAVIVFPGGGYQILAIDLEGTEVCDWLTARGITCVLLKYRVPSAGWFWDQACGCDRRTHSSKALEDAQRAISLVRFHAAEWHIDPHKIGVLGFSAGGHMVATTSTRYDRRVYAPVDSADRESARPDFAVAIYPGHLFDYHRNRLSADLPVTSATPPTFLIHAENDNVDGPSHTLFYYMALKDAHVPVELHMYAEGRHAFGLRETGFPITHWPRLVETWLRTIGMIH
jgi:acetyl esterase/lipase